MPLEVTFEGQLQLGVAFGEIGLDSSEFHKIAEMVRRIVERFMADFPETEFTD